MHVAADMHGHDESENGKVEFRAESLNKAVNSASSERNKRSETGARDQRQIM